jgi:hypothetical protein
LQAIAFVTDQLSEKSKNELQAKADGKVSVRTQTNSRLINQLQFHTSERLDKQPPKHENLRFFKLATRDDAGYPINSHPDASEVQFLRQMAALNVRNLTFEWALFWFRNHVPGSGSS